MIVVCLMQQLVQNCWKIVKFEAPHEGDENSKAGTTVLKRNDHFSFNIQEDSLLKYEKGEVSATTAKIQNWLIEILNPGESQKYKLCRRSREMLR